MICLMFSSMDNGGFDLIYTFFDLIYTFFDLIYTFSLIQVHIQTIGRGGLDELVTAQFVIPCTDWAYNAHYVLFEQSKSAHYVPSL